MRHCVRCNNILQDTCNKTCATCIAYIGENMIWCFCGDSFTRTNKSRHQRSFRCISRFNIVE